MAEGFDEIIFWMINRTVCYAKLPCCKLKCRTQWVFFLHFGELKPHAISACCYLSTMGQHGLVQPEHHLGCAWTRTGASSKHGLFSLPWELIKALCPSKP